jgi:hypothetical protein
VRVCFYIYQGIYTQVEKYNTFVNHNHFHFSLPFRNIVLLDTEILNRLSQFTQASLLFDHYKLENFENQCIKVSELKRGQQVPADRQYRCPQNALLLRTPKWTGNTTANFLKDTKFPYPSHFPHPNITRPLTMGDCKCHTNRITKAQHKTNAMHRMFTKFHQSLNCTFKFLISCHFITLLLLLLLLCLLSQAYSSW